MSLSNAVNWCEIPVKDLNRAKSFYESVTDRELSLHEMGPNQMAWFPMVDGAPGATGALIKGEEYTPSTEGAVIYLSVKDLEGALEKVKKLGGKVLVPKFSIGE